MMSFSVYLLLSKEFITIKLSSSIAIISPVSVPFNNNSPRVLKFENSKSTIAQSAITCFSFASISFSFTALMHISYLNAIFSKVLLKTISRKTYFYIIFNFQ